MAKKTFDQATFKRGRETPDFDSADYNPDEHTYNVIEDFKKEPTKEKLPEVVRTIERDTRLSSDQKDRLIDSIKRDFVSLFSLKELPSDYATLKEESKFLAQMAQSSFVLLAVRIKKIRDEELYREDNYPDFKSFIEGELSVAQRTAYNYIDIITIFGLKTFAIEDGRIDPSKLIPAIPLLRMEGVPVESIKKEMISDAKTMSARAMAEKVKQLKEEYSPKKKNAPKTQVAKTAEDIKVVIKQNLKGLSAKDKKTVVENLRKYLETI